jgi:hypothetical protein
MEKTLKNKGNAIEITDEFGIVEIFQGDSRIEVLDIADFLLAVHEYEARETERAFTGTTRVP